MKTKNAAAGKSPPHDSAVLHATGEARYIDDIPLPANALHAAIGISQCAHAEFKTNLAPVRASPGVVAVAAAADIPGKNEIAPVRPGDPLFAEKTVHYAGQCIFAVAAADEKSARRAAQKAKITYREKPAVLTMEDALRKKSFLIPEKDFFRLRRGDAKKEITRAPHRLRGEVRCGAQEHFYLEGQAAAALPQEGGDMLIYSSTQHPAEIQKLAADVLGIAMHNVVVQTRRIGGGFGGKETQAALAACAAAVLAQKTGRAVKLRLPRAEDFAVTGKRHPFLGKYLAGFDKNGKILGAQITLAADCGMSADLSHAIIRRAVLHAHNAYYYPAADITGIPCKTNKASNTAFRGFGGPQGMLLAEKMITDIARFLGRDALAVRRANFIADGQRTPYGQIVHKPPLADIAGALARNASYAAKKKAAEKFNKENKTRKRGVALTPVKFGISFTTKFLNQAGALLQIYRDGTVALNHGGTEMGQGLFIKIAQIAASVFGVPLDCIRCQPTNTARVPNASATAASSGADLNGMAAQNAAMQLRARIAATAARHWKCAADTIVFSEGTLRCGKRAMSFAQAADIAHRARVSLSAAGFYRTPKIHFDEKTARGSPFYYFACGAALVCCEINLHTGEHRLLSADILHETGSSINPAMDLGQIEGGFAQGWGWLSCEEICRNEKGALTTTGPATYKIPTAGDMPPHFRVRLWKKPNAAKTVLRSKAVGEPPLMLALAGWCALADAIHSANGDAKNLNAPATPEQVLSTLPELN